MVILVPGYKNFDFVGNFRKPVPRKMVEFIPGY
jgi:hypothetical protein